jgi:hypothetical protein
MNTSKSNKKEAPKSRVRLKDLPAKRNPKGGDGRDISVTEPTLTKPT